MFWQTIYYQNRSELVVATNRSISALTSHHVSPVILTDAGDHLPRPADIHLLNGQLALVVPHHTEEPLGPRIQLSPRSGWSSRRQDDPGTV